MEVGRQLLARIANPAPPPDRYASVELRIPRMSAAFGFAPRPPAEKLLAGKMNLRKNRKLSWNLRFYVGAAFPGRRLHLVHAPNGAGVPGDERRRAPRRRYN